MANQKISELPKATELSGQEEFVFALGGTNGTTTANAIKEHVIKDIKIPEVDTSSFVTTDILDKRLQDITGAKMAIMTEEEYVAAEKNDDTIYYIKG